ncbi:hypothetical protein PVAND_009394 [Polypedilum vanderplanki]|uniref:SCP domain-containing protein n=1 Tax=Polypedilum vanderplanki TaxID=319348 RepID=A0A9J6CCG4_POLVA|nr:hypothetical protein PVAND_009394 [Polypedilum vanderplanki]
MKYLIIFALVVFARAQTDWCNIENCSPGTHVQCLYSNTTFGSACTGNNPVIQPMTPIVQEIILDRHNYYRNQVAGGSVVGYENVVLPPAVRMASMRWDNDLAHFALLNARQCIFAHDQCRRTNSFRWAGQNLAALMTSYTETSPNFDLSEFLMRMITNWFNEHAWTRVSDINTLTTIYNGNQAIGHFTALVNELQTHIGCAIIHYNDGTWRRHNLVCNYAFTNMLNFPVYRSGTAGSQCTTGRNPLFSNLCSVNENINPNPFLNEANVAFEKN